MVFLPAKAESRMENFVTLDVIIPSFRCDKDALVRIIELPHGDFLKVTFCIVVDNPSTSALPNFEVPSAHVLVIKNSTNLGAAMSRNVGLAATRSDWVLFLDDDIAPEPDLLLQYEKFIRLHGNDFMGATGLTQFPEPVNSFTRGIRASEILTFFGIAGWYRSLKWGITANVLIKRSRVGEQKFSSDFPKKGGGEDIDFFLRCCANNTQEFLCLPQAKVHHDWWHGGKRTYRRFFRWAYGDGLLPTRFPQNRYWNLPNIAEWMLLWLLLLPVCIHFHIRFAALIPLAVLLGDMLVEFCKQAIAKQTWNPFVAVEATLIRFANDCGRCCGNLSRGRILFIGERFDYFCDGKHIQHEKLLALLKTVGYLMVLCLLFLML